MRNTLSIVVAGLLFSGSVYAEEQKAVAEVTPVVTKEVKKAKKKVDLSFGGDAQFRLRYHYKIEDDGTEKDPETTDDYTNQYAWNLKVKAKVGENVTFGFRISNPSGYATDKVGDQLKKISSDNYQIISIPEAYVCMATKVVALRFGVIPVMSNVVLNLAYHETDDYLNKSSCCEAGVSSWKVYMNNSQTGLGLNFNLLKNEQTSLGLNIVSSIALNSGAGGPGDALKNDQLRFIYSIPVSLLAKKLTFNPVLHMRTNVERSEDKEKANHSLTGGIDVAINPIKQLAVKVGFAAGGYSNDAVKSADPVSSPIGILLNSNITVKPGFGKAIVGFNFATTKDREVKDAIVQKLIHLDFKYGIPVKGITIMPRFRIWAFPNSKTEAKETWLRPELIFSGKF